MKTLQKKLNESLGLQNVTRRTRRTNSINEAEKGTFDEWYELVVNKVCNNFKVADKFNSKIQDTFLKDKRFLDHAEYDWYTEEDFEGEDNVEAKVEKANAEMTEIYIENLGDIYIRAIDSILERDAYFEEIESYADDEVEFSKNSAGLDVKVTGNLDDSDIHSNFYDDGKTGEECIRNKYIQSLNQRQEYDMDDNHYFWNDQGGESAFNPRLAADIFIDILKKDKDWKKLLAMKF